MNEFSLSDLAAVTGGNRNGDGFGDGNGWWVLILFILLGGFGRGYGYGNQGGGYGAGNVGGNELYPWLNNADQINSGFRDQMLQTGIQGINTGVQNLATQLCQCCGDMQMALANGFAGVNLGMANGFAGVQQSLCNGFNNTNVALLEGFNNIEQGANNRQMANMQAMFNQQLATQQGFNGVQGQLAQQTATILSENCADRAALSDGVRDIIQSQTANTQSILDKLCQLELDGVKGQLAQAERENIALQNQLNMANLAASQTAQNQLITQGFANEVDALYNRLNSCPVPTTPVYGRTPIFTCGQNQYGCGCGCAS
jgi:hypothetical protein